MLCAAAVLFTTSSYAASVSIKNGNIYYADNGVTKQLTSLGRDEYPLLHPKGEWVYFVRGGPGKWKDEKYYPAKGEVIKDGIVKDEIWRVRIDCSKSERLYRNDQPSAVDGPDPDYAFASIYNLQLSPDGDKVYFHRLEWVTSGAIHVMNQDGSGERFLGPGNETKIIISARTFDDREKSYRGYIVTSQHRYHFYGGSYDWFYLFTPDMKREVASLGDDIAYFTEMGDMTYTDGSEKDIVKDEKPR
jgi:hypothetical protein